MILTSLEFRVKDGGAEALAEVYRRHRILDVAATVPGCLDLYYAVSERDPQLVTVFGVWDDRAAYDLWLEHPYRDTAEDEFDAQMAGDWEPTAAAVIADVLVFARGRMPSAASPDGDGQPTGNTGGNSSSTSLPASSRSA